MPKPMMLPKDSPVIGFLDERLYSLVTATGRTVICNLSSFAPQPYEQVDPRYREKQREAQTLEFGALLRYARENGATEIWEGGERIWAAAPGIPKQNMRQPATKGE